MVKHNWYMALLRDVASMSLRAALFSLFLQASILSYFIFFFVLLLPSTIPSLEWYRRASLGALISFVLAGVIYFVIVLWIIFPHKIRKRFDFLDGVAITMTIIVPLSFVFGVLVALGSVLALGVQFHLVYAIVTLSLYGITNYRIASKLIGSAQDEIGRLFQVTASHLDFPAVISFILLLLVLILTYEGKTPLNPQEFEKFVSGALTFEVTTLQTALFVTQSKVGLAAAAFRPPGKR